MYYHVKVTEKSEIKKVKQSLSDKKNPLEAAILQVNNF